VKELGLEPAVKEREGVMDGELNERVDVVGA